MMARIGHIFLRDEMKFVHISLCDDLKSWNWYVFLFLYCKYEKYESQTFIPLLAKKHYYPHSIVFNAKNKELISYQRIIINSAKYKDVEYF